MDMGSSACAVIPLCRCVCARARAHGGGVGGACMRACVCLVGGQSSPDL